MRPAFASIALFVAGAFAQGFTIITPSNVVECQPTLISWSGGTAPYYLSILPGATPSATAIESFPATNSTSVTWIVNIASGTYIGITLRDSTGAVAQSAPFSINPGSTNSCLNSTSVVPGPTGGSSAATTGGAASTGTKATSAAASTSTSTSSSGASANVAQFGAAGIVGAAVAALFL